MSGQRTTRRAVLAAVGAAALAGCNTDGGNRSGNADGTAGNAETDGTAGGGNTTEGSESANAGAENGGPDVTGGSRLASLRVANNDDTAHRVALQIERNSEVVHWTDHDLDARSAGESSVFTVEPDWPEDRATFVVEVQVDGERHRQFDIGGGECRNVFVEIDGDGRLTKYANSDDCGSDGNETANVSNI